MIGVYKIVNIKNNKIYVGSSLDIESRIKTHFSNLLNNKHRNLHLQNSFNKYGENCFIWEVLEICNKDLLLTKEQYYIDKYWSNSYNKAKQAYSGGWNLTTKEYVLIDLDGNMVDRFYSGRDLKRYLNVNSRDLSYNNINTDSKFKRSYRIVTLEFFENNKDIIYSWKNYDEIYC